jgi:hypothetical protein
MEAQSRSHGQAEPPGSPGPAPVTNRSLVDTSLGRFLLARPLLACPPCRPRRQRHVRACEDRRPLSSTGSRHTRPARSGTSVMARKSIAPVSLTHRPQFWSPDCPSSRKCTGRESNPYALRRRNLKLSGGAKLSGHRANKLDGRSEWTRKRPGRGAIHGPLHSLTCTATPLLLRTLATLPEHVRCTRPSGTFPVVHRSADAHRVCLAQYAQCLVCFRRGDPIGCDARAIGGHGGSLPRAAGEVLRCGEGPHDLVMKGRHAGQPERFKGPLGVAP